MEGEGGSPAGPGRSPGRVKTTNCSLLYLYQLTLARKISLQNAVQSMIANAFEYINWKVNTLTGKLNVNRLQTARTFLDLELNDVIFFQHAIG